MRDTGEEFVADVDEFLLTEQDTGHEVGGCGATNVSRVGHASGAGH